MPEEFEGMGADYRTRGRVTDESIEMFKALCTEETASYSGRHFGISGKSFLPQAAAEAAPADLDWRRQQGGDAAGGPGWATYGSR